jgi:hypothetical protein
MRSPTTTSSIAVVTTSTEVGKADVGDAPRARARLRSTDDASSGSDQLPCDRATAAAGCSVPSGVRQTMPGTGNVFVAPAPATRRTQQRCPPLRKYERTDGARYAFVSAPWVGSQASGASLPKIVSKCDGSSIATGMPMGPDAAKPTKRAMSIRGNT